MTSAPQVQVKVARLQTHAQFEAVLQQSVSISNFYFVLHHGASKLSTEPQQEKLQSVDNLFFQGSRLGLIIPKRWAKRAVTRSLVKRQCRAQFALAAADLPAGDWIIRLRRSLDSGQWNSASSPALKQHVRQEIQHLLAQAQQRWSKEHSYPSEQVLIKGASC
ncbi:ribonuclease P protein component [Saezia sanguinis]|uniref:ribonuclease P protein component n=1 Tax=Saezia sanguinis TaxID=1965230 RepID=UPI00307025FB